MLARRQQGFGMIEFFAIVVGVLVLVAAMFALNEDRKAASALGEFNENLHATKANIERLFSRQPSYVGLDNALAVRAKLVPSSMVMGDMDSTEITSPYGLVTVETDSSGTYGQANSHYRITAEDVPQETCIEVATYSRTDWVDVLVGGTSINENDPVAASGACGGEDENEIEFIDR